MLYFANDGNGGITHKRLVGKMAIFGKVTKTNCVPWRQAQNCMDELLEDDNMNFYHLHL